AQREERERKGEDQEQRADQRVDQSQEQACDQSGTGARHVHTGNEPRRDDNRNRVQHKARQEVHAPNGTIEWMASEAPAGAWLFRYRSILPVPLAVILILVRQGQTRAAWPVAIGVIL